MTDGLRAEVQKADDGGWYFRIVAANNETVATGETYHNRADAEKTAELILAGQGRVVVTLADDD